MEKYSETKVISFVGYSGSGKTTFIVQVIEELKKRGLTLALIKHDAHEFDLDHEGKDTYKFYHSGADIVTIFSKTKSGMMANNDALLKGCTGAAPCVKRIIKSLPKTVDLVIVEGCRESDIPKIGFSRCATNKGLSMKPSELVALITDEVSDEYLSENPDLKVFGLDDVKEVSDYIEEGTYMTYGADMTDYTDSFDRIFAEKPNIKEIYGILEQIKLEGGSEWVPISNASERISFEKVTFADAYPMFPMAACDGYAFRMEDTQTAQKEGPVYLKITENVHAGTVPEYVISKGYAAEVSAGARLPYGADIVEKTEYIGKIDDKLVITGEYTHEKNIIAEGSLYKRGYVIADKGDKLTPEKTERLCLAGFDDVNVYKKPKVFIIGTGSELLESDSSEDEVKIRNSTAYLAGSIAQKAGAETVYFGTVEDNAKKIADKIRKALTLADIVITTGGASEGGNDCTLNAFKAVGAKILVWQTSEMPMKTLIIAKKKEKMLIGIPGTPRSAALAMRLVGKYVIEKAAGQNHVPKKVKLVLSKPVQKRFSEEEYISGNIEYDDTMAFFTPKLSDPDKGISEEEGPEAVGILPEGMAVVNAGTVVDVYII